MSTQITTAFVQEFTDGITHLAQQKGSRLRDGVSVSTVTGDRAYFDQLGATVMTQRTTRHADTDYTDTPHARRMVTLAPYDVADLVDRPDMVRTLNDPTNPYVQAFANAAGRQTDDIIIAAFFATASTGVDGTGTEAFDTTNQQVLDGGAAGLTLTRLLTAKEIFQANEEDDMTPLYVAVSARQVRDLLTEAGGAGGPHVTSADYFDVKMLVRGEVTNVSGVNFKRSERLSAGGTGGDRRCPMWIKDGVKLAVGAEPRGEIDVLPTKRYSTQVFYSLDMGATRMRNTAVVDLQCDET